MVSLLTLSTLWAAEGEGNCTSSHKYLRCVAEWGSPTFPNVQASGVLGVKSWMELFSVLEPLIRCLKWEHFVSQLRRELHTWFSLSFSFSIWNDFIANYDSFMSEYTRESKLSLPVDSVICKTGRESTGRGLRSDRGNSSTLHAYSPDCQGN